MDRSILFWGLQPPAREEEACWQDLNLDQLLQAVCPGRDRDFLQRLWQTPVGETDRLQRLAVFRDLEQPPVVSLLAGFAQTVEKRQQRLQQEEKIFDPWQRRWQQSRDFLLYGRDLTALEEALKDCSLRSEGLQLLRQCVAAHNRNNKLPARLCEGEALLQELAGLQLRIRCRGTRVTVLPGPAGPDYGAQVAHTFAGFRDQGARDYTCRRFAETPWLNRVEEGVAAGAAKLYPAVFSHLQAFAEQAAGPVDVQLARLARELQFYLSYLELMEPLRQKGLPFCHPVRTEDGSMRLEQCFDLALANRACGKEIVCNDWTAARTERLFTVTGANQGGKTTYVRMVGQVLWLAALGLPVPGRQVELSPVDRILTHFERAENVETENGKLMEELQRLRILLKQATAHSVVIFNETFSSTTAADARWLAEQVLQQLRRLGCRCLYVTFLPGSLGPDLVSLRSIAGPQGERTYRICRAKADGKAYGVTLARRHGLLYEQIMERMKP